MRRFFFGAESFDFFSRNQRFQTSPRQIPLTKQGVSVRPTAFSVNYFLSTHGGIVPKNCREIPGGAAMTGEGAA
jgi:hypothetical protein